MLQLDIKTLLEDRGIDKPNRFLVRAGFSPQAASRLLYNENDKISFKKLEKLCLALNCTPDEILVWRPSGGITYADNHVLLKLKPRSRKGIITASLPKLSQEKLDHLREYIEKLHTSNSNTL